MSDHGDVIGRIAAALERIAPETAPFVDWLSDPAYLWSGKEARALSALDALPLEQLRGIGAQKTALFQNLNRFSKGAAAHDMLLWGARGMGKSALIRACVLALQQDEQNIALVQIGSESMHEIPALLQTLAEKERAYVLFIDDLGFGERDLQTNLALRSLLDGGAMGRPANVKVAVTSNRRAIVQREASSPAELHERDERDNALALADRFGLALAFHPCSSETYLEIVRSYTDPLGLTVDETEAQRWAIARGNRSGRTAFQFACELAGRAEKAL